MSPIIMSAAAVIDLPIIMVYRVRFIAFRFSGSNICINRPDKSTEVRVILSPRRSNNFGIRGGSTAHQPAVRQNQSSAPTDRYQAL